MPTNTIRTYEGSLQIAKQEAKGTKATTGFHQFRRVDGRISVAKELDSVNYIDGSAWSADDFDFVKSISGTGSLTIQATPEGASRLLAWALGGSDTVTGEENPYTHTITAGTGLTYLTVIDSVGTGSGIIDTRTWTDCVITQVEVTSTHDAGVVSIKLDLLAITGESNGTTAPSAASTSDSEPLLHTQGVGNIKVAGLNSGNAIPEVEQFVLTVDTNIELLFGDSVNAYIAHRKRGQISWSATAAVTDTTLAALNKSIYGTATPSAGTAPSTGIFTGAFNPKLVQSASRELSVNIPNNRIMVETGSIDPNAAGDKATISIAGMARKPVSGQLITVASKTGDSGAY